MSIFDERLNKILGRVDHLKTKENPEGNLFFHNNLSVEEAKQAIKQLIASELGAIIDANIDPDHAIDTDRVYEALVEWIGELQGGGNE